MSMNENLKKLYDQYVEANKVLNETREKLSLGEFVFKIQKQVRETLPVKIVKKLTNQYEEANRLLKDEDFISIEHNELEEIFSKLEIEEKNKEQFEDFKSRIAEQLYYDKIKEKWGTSLINGLEEKELVNYSFHGYNGKTINSSIDIDEFMNNGKKKFDYVKIDSPLYIIRYILYYDEIGSLFEYVNPITMKIREVDDLKNDNKMYILSIKKSKNWGYNIRLAIEDGIGYYNNFKDGFFEEDIGSYIMIKNTIRKRYMINDLLKKLNEGIDLKKYAKQKLEEMFKGELK